MSNLSFTVPPKVSGERAPTLAAALRAHNQMSWGKAQTLCERGKVSVDGAVVIDAATRVKPGSEILVDERRPAPKPQTVPILFEDGHVVVIDKPSGISSVPFEKRDGDTAMDAIRDAWRAQGKKATEQALFVVHRIDKDTSGLIAFAKTKEAEKGMQALFRTHDVERTYLCLAHGTFDDRRIESRLVEDRGDGLRGSTRTPGKGKRAVTHVHRLEALPDTTYCEVKLETGKTHQIRIHLSELGHPIVGETVYVRDYTRKVGEPIPSPRLLLHAATLGFVHPITGEHVRLEVKPPQDFERIVSVLRRRPVPAPKAPVAAKAPVVEAAPPKRVASAKAPLHKKFSRPKEAKR